ncbi:hypothetical protein BMS3Bbin03_01945 [bacterium BMS3Bbin03]|nr:hypothetical protein BMS3Bbin03_01945 [bacterium BMS3Bbin03]
MPGAVQLNSSVVRNNGSFFLTLGYGSWLSGKVSASCDSKTFVFFIPPAPRAKSRCAVLSTPDDKIELLHRQNKTLEVLAETLFRQWFIEPARAGKPHAGGEVRVKI